MPLSLFVAWKRVRSGDVQGITTAFCFCYCVLQEWGGWERLPSFSEKTFNHEGLEGTRRKTFHRRGRGGKLLNAKVAKGREVRQEDLTIKGTKSTKENPYYRGR